MDNSICFIDLFDWEKESDAHYMRMLQGSSFEEDEEREPAGILIKIKTKKDDNQTNKRTFRRARKKGFQP